MDCILTKYHGPTNTRGSRISATVPYGNKRRTYFYPYQYGLNSTENHAHAARLTAERLGWDGLRWHAGYLPTGGYAFVAEMAEPAFVIARDTNR